MPYDFSNLRKKTEQAQEWLRREYLMIRTGRATPAILDGVKIEAYNTKMPVNQAATISSEGSKTLRIVPWDLSQAKSIERAIEDANLGLSVAIDDKGLRIHFPDLSEERRIAMKKIIRQKLEEAKVSLRGAREEAWEDIQQKVKEGGLGEDDKFRLKGEMQNIVDETGKKLEEIAEKKEKEVMN